jgi:hypothetical protein
LFEYGLNEFCLFMTRWKVLELRNSKILQDITIEVFSEQPASIKITAEKFLPVITIGKPLRVIDNKVKKKCTEKCAKSHGILKPL